jgi:predicted nucleic acid-binding Zn ribbon protein
MGGLADALRPSSPLGDVQRVWAAAVGATVAAQAEPTAVADGVVTVTCSSATWAQELDLMSVELVDRLNAALGGGRVTRLRCQAAPSRSWARKG